MTSITATEMLYAEGDFFLGQFDGYPMGVKSERHAITVAGSRSGKGACVIIPNLLRWADNVLVVDPKGENAEKTWEARQAMGSKVYVLDPFETANVPAHLRASFNPLEGIDPDSLTGSADLEVIADGLVKRSDPKHAQWDDGAVTLLAGVMAFVIAEAPEEHRTLKAVRDILLQDRDDIYADAQRMKECEAFDGIAQDAGAIIMGAFDNEKGMEADFLSAAKRHIKWINIRAMRNVLESSTFSLSELKNGKASVYVVLPPEYLKTHSAFMRLFTIMAINAMAKGGSGRGEKCLFMLDEFYSLGKIEAVATASGLMPSYGVHLWPFLQDLGQLIDLYGKEGSESFFANADVHQFFGNTDQLTLEQISVRLGTKNLSQMPLPPRPPSSAPSAFGQGVSGLAAGSRKGSIRAMGAVTGGMISSVTNNLHASEQADYQHQMSLYQRALAEHGKPQMSPEEVARKIRKKDDVVADKMVCFLFGSEPVWLSPAPYFRELKSLDELEEDEDQLRVVSSNAFGWKMSDGEFHWSHGGRVIFFTIVGVVIGGIFSGLGAFSEPLEGIASIVVIVNVIGFIVYRAVTGRWGQFEDS